MSLNSPSDMALRLKQCAMELSRWNLYAFGKVPKKIQEKRRSLSNLVQRDRNGSLGREINALRKEINDLLDSEEIMWQQRSRVQWLGLGDQHTKYYHSKAFERRKKNTITGLMDENGNWCDSTESIAAVAVSYFEKLFSTSYPSSISGVTNTIPTRVTDEMNQWLIKEFTREEVVTALQQMHPTKAPGPDGMSTIFFQKYWDIVGNDITCMVLNVLNSNMSMVEINRTNIALVSKTNSSTKMTEFRPISLCNVNYKLISKVLANRLKAILP